MGKILHCGELTRANLSLQPFSKDRIRLTSQLILSQKRESDVFFSFLEHIFLLPPKVQFSSNTNMPTPNPFDT